MNQSNVNALMAHLGLDGTVVDTTLVQVIDDNMEKINVQVLSTIWDKYDLRTKASRQELLLYLDGPREGYKTVLKILYFPNTVYESSEQLSDMTKLSMSHLAVTRWFSESIAGQDYTIAMKSYTKMVVKMLGMRLAVFDCLTSSSYGMDMPVRLLDVKLDDECIISTGTVGDVLELASGVPRDGCKSLLIYRAAVIYHCPKLLVLDRFMCQQAFGEIGSLLSSAGVKVEKLFLDVLKDGIQVISLDKTTGSVPR